MLSTELTRTFGLKHPIVSAPMANWSGGVLAGAVSAGGGLGMIGVLAAGGLATGRAVAGVLAMGATGAWVGTRFCATVESAGTEEAKQCILQADETQTIHTHVFDIVQNFPWPEEFPGRAISNAFSERWHGREEGES